MFGILVPEDYSEREKILEFLNHYHVKIPLHGYPESLSKKVSFSSL